MTVEITGLAKAFGEVRALDGVDLQVPPGSVTALLGPNGAGKTTVLRILATLLRPDAGRAVVAGADVVRQPREVRRRIGLAGQHAAVDDDLTGRENLVILGLMLHLGRRRARARADELLVAFGLDDAADRLVRTWSGGMRRRLDLLASLVVGPRVLFLDEPTTGLDPHSRTEIWTAVRGLAAGGTTVLLTTQYLEEADRLADDVVILDRGRVVAHGTPDHLKDAIGVRVDVAVESAGQLAGARSVLERWSAGGIGVDDDRLGLTAGVPAGAVTLPELVRALDEAGVRVHDVGVRRPTLDEVFLDRIGGTHRADPDGEVAA
jgi:ABC-2 type transport system ATP-binding protein